MARRKLQPATFPLFDWADACVTRLRDERRMVARPRRRQSREAGQLSYLSGLAAEDCVARDYEGRGFQKAETRWRGKGGEIDLILADGEGLIFVEVKKADTFDQAAHYLTERQTLRILAAATEYLGEMPKGQLTQVRFDVALVNASGQIRVIENASMT